MAMYPGYSGMYDDEYDEGYYDPMGRPGRAGDMPLPTVTLPEGVDMSSPYWMEGKEWERPKRKRRKRKKGKYNVLDFMEMGMAPY